MSKGVKEYKEYFDKENLEETKSVVSSETETIEEETPIPEQSSAKPKKCMKLTKPSKKPKKETPEQKKARVKTEISELHQRYKTLNSQNLHQEFNSEPTLWHTYHEISEANEQSFPENEIPRNRIIQELHKLTSKSTKTVVDMGCGKGQISSYFSNDRRFIFKNYDHVSSNDTIISCDISKIPLEEDSVDICILSLSMWGSNCKEYLTEAFRVLDSQGYLYIIEPTRRWSEKDDNNGILPGTEGIKLKALLEETGFHIFTAPSEATTSAESIPKFCMFRCCKMPK